MVWVEKPALVADKSNWKAYGYEVFSVDEFNHMIGIMIELMMGKRDTNSWIDIL